MNVEKLKVVLEILLQELNNESDKCTNYLRCDTFKLPNELFNDICNTVPDIFESVVDNLNKMAKLEMAEENHVKKIIFKSLLITFLNTTQQERFLYLKDILKHFYNKLVQKLIELQECSSIVSVEDFNEIVTKLLPFVKLQVVKKLSESEKIGNELKISLMELYETVLYPNISREDCYEIIKNKLVDYDDVEFSDFQIKPVDEKNGFLGEYFKIKIYITNCGKSEVHNFFFKHLPTKIDEVRKTMAEISFKKEEAFYMKIIPYLEKLGCADITDILPKCYLSRKNKFMVLDDASAMDFHNLDIKVPFTYKQLSIILKQLAKFHCCGILLEEKLSDILGINFRLNNYYSDMLLESFAVRNNEHTKNLFDCSIETNAYAFDKCSHLFKPHTLENFKKQCSEAFMRYYDISEPSKTDRNFITHGDLWCNNIMFNSDQTSCLLLDFQIIRYNSPAYDILFLCATNTDLETRMKYESKLLDEYYIHLKNNLSKHNVDVDKILTYNQFLKSVDDVVDTALVLALSYLLFMLLPKERMTRVFEDPVLSQYFFMKNRTNILDELWDDLECKSRYEDIIQELYLLYLGRYGH